MGSKYAWKMTPLAEADIDGALSYITEHLLNKTAAQRLFSALNKTINNICEFPMSYAVLLSAALLAVGALESKGQLLLWQELFPSGNLLILRALLDLALNLLLGWLLGKWAVRRASLYSF